MYISEEQKDELIKHTVNFNNNLLWFNQKIDKLDKKEQNEEILNNNVGDCPKDNRPNRPIFIIYNNLKTLAVADGKGDCYKVYGEGYEVFNSICKEENKYNPSDYKFDRGLNGMDF